MCTSPIQGLWGIISKEIIHLRSIRLDQDKFYLAQKVRDFLLPQCQMELTDQADRDFQTDKPTQSKFPGIEQMINHTRCLSNGLDEIYTQKSMSISRYTQLATLTNVNAQSTTWSEILARQLKNGSNS